MTSKGGIFESAKRAVVQVGEGRGFVVEHGHQRFIITASHCLPFLPPCDPACYAEERTYKDLLAPLGEERTVWAECYFVDPVADIAVLGTPDDQMLFQQGLAYDKLVDTAVALPIADIPNGPVYVLSLDGDWTKVAVELCARLLWIDTAAGVIAGGMSGSPILTEGGAAIGVVVTGSLEGHEGSLNPYLLYHLPGWLLHQTSSRR